ncbi:hypothetical protein LY78DRAFT_664747 [Colletotrichum sublineola]|nr:hypothetical protein LY78DRAFT_664747 [Colletotrichum sublineola]
MFRHGIHLAGIWSLVAQSAIAQQFAMRRTSYELLNLSGSCFEALNTTVDCSDRLAKHVAWEYVCIPLILG